MMTSAEAKRLAAGRELISLTDTYGDTCLLEVISVDRWHIYGSNAEVIDRGDIAKWHVVRTMPIRP